MSDSQISLEQITIDIRIADGPAGKKWTEAMGGRDRWYATPFVDLSGGIAEVANVEYASVHPIGRTEAYKTYMGVNNREVSLLLHYVADGIGSIQDALVGKPSYMGVQAASSESSTVDSIRNTVINPALWLENLKYPYQDPTNLSGFATGAVVAYAPPPVNLVIGSLLYMRALATNVQVKWGGPWYTPDSQMARPGVDSLVGEMSGLLPMSADVQITFTSVSPNPSGALGLFRMDQRPGFKS